MDVKKAIKKYILMIAIFFFLFLIGRVFYDYTDKNEMLFEQLRSFNDNIHIVFENEKKQLSQKYSLLIQHFLNSQKVYQLFKEDKHEQLYQLLKKDYNDFKNIDKNLFVMHFIDTKNITVLRMHKPNSFDDDLSLKRPIVAFANKSLKQQIAFEIGKNSIVYRITTPYIHNNDHIGVLEFGIKLSYFMDTLKESFNVSSALVVNTDHLKVLLAQKDYKRLGEYSLVSKEPQFDNIIDLIDLKKQQQVIYKENKTYLVCSLNLEDFNGNIVSKILVSKDITAITNQNNMWFYLVNVGSFLVYMLIIFVMLTVLVKFANEIQRHTRTITKLNRKTQYFQTKANTDNLTKIFNKEYFNKNLKLFLDEKKTGVLMFFDIDHFKKVNDTHGHIHGDEILKNMSQKIKEHLRGDDIFARWGGEEFVILLASTDLNHAYSKAEYLRKLIENEELYDGISITISIGLAQIEPDESFEDLVQRADSLLYKAKENGRNCVMV